MKPANRRKLRYSDRLPALIFVASLATFAAAGAPLPASGAPTTPFSMTFERLSVAQCMDRGGRAVQGGGLALGNRGDWWLSGIADGLQAFVLCRDTGDGRVLLSVMVAGDSGGGAADVRDQIVALARQPAARAPTPPDRSGTWPNFTFWQNSQAVDQAECLRNGSRAMEAMGLQVDSGGAFSASGYDSSRRTTVTCVTSSPGRVIATVLIANRHADVEPDRDQLVAFIRDPSSIPQRPIPKPKRRIATLGGSQPPAAGAAGSTVAASEALTERRAATADCQGAVGNQYQDVRFTLAAPATIRVLVPDPPGKATWWIQNKDYNGIIMANMDAGVPIVVPPGADMAKGLVPLPAGTFIFHVDCSPAGVGRVVAQILLPPMPTPAGPRYLVLAKDQSDRIFYLTAAQTVKFSSAPPLTGSIIDFPRTLLWSRDQGKLEAWSTQDLLPGGYCLHGDWPDQVSGAFPVEIIGPRPPGGPIKRLTATSRASASGIEDSRGVQFTLIQSQVIKVLDTRTAWIIDTAGNLWFNIVNGEVQSGSSWVQSTGNAMDAPGVDLPGVLLPPGTYHFAVSTRSGQASGQVAFVGKKEASFDWPAEQIHPCFPHLHHTIKLPTVGTALRLGGIPEAMRECWKGREVSIDSRRAGQESQQPRFPPYDTYTGDTHTAQDYENLWVEDVSDPEQIRSVEETNRQYVWYGDTFGKWTTYKIPGTSITAYLATTQRAMHVEELDQNEGRIGVQQKFEFHCGKLQVSGTSGRFTQLRWGRDPETGTGMVAPVGTQAEVERLAGTVRQQAEKLMSRFTDNLMARGLCAN